MKKLSSLALTDFKLIFRDPSLRSFLALPLLFFSMVLYVLPWLVNKFPEVEAYLPILLCLMLIENTQMFSFINSMVFIDEKETQVNKVYATVPLSTTAFIGSRMLLPYTITVLLNFILLLIQPFYELAVLPSLLLSILIGLIVPIYVMLMTKLVENRMKGMVYIKALNILVLLPFAAFFVPDNLLHIFGLLPTHWCIQAAYEFFTEGAFVTNFLFALLYFVLLLIYLLKRFRGSHFGI